MKKILFLVCVLLLSTTVLAQEEYHLKLLAVQEHEGKYQGSEADLFLELRPGTGRVFLDTQPVTKLDTQISTRFAKEIACKHMKLDCERYDFIYTIRANTNIIGGPSAGAAISALTAIAVLDLEYNNNVAITGTINSGATIGPVGGVKEKLEIASQIGVEKVLISTGNRIQHTVLNGTLDLVDYAAQNLTLEAMEVVDLQHVVHELTGVRIGNGEITLRENKQYQEIMEQLQKSLCDRMQRIEVELGQQNIYIEKELRETLTRRSAQAKNATEIGDYYSAASFCFGTNIQLKNYYYQERKVSRSILHSQFGELERKAVALKQSLQDIQIQTIADLQAFMVVNERIHDVESQLKAYRELDENTKRDEIIALLAYAEERFFSAVSWMKFFEMDGKKFVVDETLLRQSCQQKIVEAEQRIQYTELFMGSNHLAGLQERMENAKNALEGGKYALCLISASQVKGDANAIISSIGVSEDSFISYLENKQKAVLKVIDENSKDNIFPILGFSYYQYGNSLKEQEPYNALVYLEYALEMSDLGIYFPAEEGFLGKVRTIRFQSEWILVTEGFFLGIVVTVLFFRMKENIGLAKSKKKRKKKK